MTRLEGLESRAQSLSGGLTSEFNAFAYATLDELEPEYSEEEENESNAELEEVTVEELRSDPPEEKPAVKDISVDEENSEVLEWGTEDVVAYVLERVNRDIDSLGGVLNNQLHLRYPEGIKGTPETKRMLKELLAEDETIQTHKLDKFRAYTTEQEMTPMSYTSESLAKRWLKKGEVIDDIIERLTPRFCEKH